MPRRDTEKEAQKGNKLRKIKKRKRGRKDRKLKKLADLDLKSSIISSYQLPPKGSTVPLNQKYALG